MDVGAVKAPTIRRSHTCKRSPQLVSISPSRFFKLIVRRQLKRRYVLPFFQKLPPCLIGIEACASSHHWSRELQALGHTVRLMPPAYVRPYVKRQKNDAADAEAICEAVTRANMRFVATKTPEQQSCLMLHRTRHLFIRQQTAVINAIRFTGLKPSRFRRLGLSNCSHGRIYSASISLSLVLISGLSRKTMFNKELWTSSFPLYSIKPSLRNLFMKKLTRDRVVPIISASVS